MFKTLLLTILTTKLKQNVITYINQLSVPILLLAILAAR